MNNYTNKIICGNCAEILQSFPDGFIDLVVTSPPYDNLRDYTGYTFDFTEIAQQIERIIVPGGVIVWVVGDETKNFCESLSSFKQAIYFVETCGLNLLDTMIFQKLNYAPAYPTMRRYAQTFEYMFVFSKGKPKTFNPIQKDKQPTTLARSQYGGSKFIRKDGTYTVPKVIQNTNPTKDACNVWGYGVGKDKLGHPAVFPEKLAQDHILSWCNPGDTVLDPMCGSGTTLKMAKILGRNYIGIDISQKYCDMTEKRLEEIE